MFETNAFAKFFAIRVRTMLVRPTSTACILKAGDDRPTRLLFLTIKSNEMNFHFRGTVGLLPSFSEQ